MQYYSPGKLALTGLILVLYDTPGLAQYANTGLVLEEVIGTATKLYATSI